MHARHMRMLCQAQQIVSVDLEICGYVEVAWLRQDDGVAEEDTDEEGTAESQSLGSDSDDAGAADDEDDDDNEAAGRRLNIRTSALLRPPFSANRPLCWALWNVVLLTRRTSRMQAGSPMVFANQSTTLHQ